MSGRVGAVCTAMFGTAWAMTRATVEKVKATARLMIGQPPYEAYLAHMAARHPEQEPLSRVDFFRNREEARFGGAGGGKCC